MNSVRVEGVARFGDELTGEDFDGGKASAYAVVIAGAPVGVILHRERERKVWRIGEFPL